MGTSIQGLYGSWTWGLDGELLSVTDANNNLTANAYDGFNRLAQVNFPMPTLGAGAANPNDFEAYTWDANGNRKTLARRDGTTTITYAYDNLDRRISKVFKVSLAQYDVAYGYDLAGRPTSALYSQVAGTPGVIWAYDAAGRRIQEATNGLAMSFTYDKAGNPRTTTWPDARAVSFVYDGAHRFVSVGNVGGTVSAGYDSLSRVSGLTRPATTGNSSTTIGHDNADRMNSLAHTFTTGAETWTFAFTGAGQLTSAASTNAAWDWQPPPASAVATAPNGLNQNASVGGAAWVYDKNGNLTSDGVRSFTYDPENRLLTESGPVAMTLSYDPTGRLQQSVIGGATTQFLYDGDALVAEYDGSGTILRRYVHCPQTDNPLIWYEGAGMGATNSHYLIADRQGTISGVANNAGTVGTPYTYSAYGVPDRWGVIGTDPRFRYTGQTAIPEAQLYYFKARMLDPGGGKFLQTDPVGDRDDLNLYAYVRGDPVDRSDPTGLSVCAAGLSGPDCGKAMDAQKSGIAAESNALAGAKAWESAQSTKTQTPAAKTFAGNWAKAHVKAPLTEKTVRNAIKGIVNQLQVARGRDSAISELPRGKGSTSSGKSIGIDAGYFAKGQGPALQQTLQHEQNHTNGPNGFNGGIGDFSELT